MAQQHYSSVDQQLDQDTDAVENNIHQEVDSHR